MALEQEIELYYKLLPGLLVEHHGEWAVIHGEACDTFHCYDDALKIGYKLFGLKPFLVKQILPKGHHRHFLGMAGKVVDGKFIPESVSMLDHPVDERCYIESIEPRVLDHPKTEAL
jgi:hypothetical protein